MSNVIVVDGKNVEIRSKMSWVFDGVDCDKVKVLNAVLFDRVQAAVGHYLDNKDAIDAANRKKEAEERVVRNAKLLGEWKGEVGVFGDLLKGKVLVFPENNVHGEFVKRVEFGNVSVWFDDEVFDNWSRRKTDKPWVVSANFKRVRYATLEKALVKAVEKDDELLKVEERKRNLQEYRVNAENRMRAFAEMNGFKLEKNYLSGNHLDFCMVKGCVSASLAYHVESDMVIIKSYTIKKDGISVKDLEGVSQ